MPAAVAVPIIMGAVGAGASIYGANKNAKAMKSANDANLAAQKESERMNYQRWLESQGVGPDGQPVNTWLPRHMMMNEAPDQPRRFRRAGSAAPAVAAPVQAGNPAIGGPTPPLS